jgi:hypothetical protein
LRISFSCLTGDKAFLFRSHGRCTFKSVKPSTRLDGQQASQAGKKAVLLK